MTSHTQPSSCSPASVPKLKTKEGLDPDSYTVHRLQHATPQHLHITTRRCFIGPIPEAWLSRHRKSWYRYRPHLSTYSSRAAIFSTAGDVSFQRRVSGLDGPSGPENSHFTSSFPQPDDISDAEDIEDHQGLPDSKPPSPFSTQANVQKAASIEVDPAPGSPPQRQVSQSSSKRKARFQPRSKYRSRKGTGTSEGGSSFVTARETLDDSPVTESDHDQAIEEEGPDDNGGDASQVTRSFDGSSFVLVDSTDGNMPQSTDATASTSALLPRSKGDGNDREPSAVPDRADHRNAPSVAEQTPNTLASQPPPRKSMNDEAMEGQQPDILADMQDADLGLKRLIPVSTALVRFNVPDGKRKDSKADPAGEVTPEYHTSTGKRGLRKSKRAPGELVKAERMLVRVDATRHELPDDFDENKGFKAEAKTVEKWREFVVVCRKSTTSEGELVLQMYKSRVIPVLEEQQTTKRFAHEIPLVRRSTKVNMYSSLDKTIVIWTPWKKGTRIYILRPRSSATSVEWYTFLRMCLGSERPSEVTVHVPDLNVTIQLDNPFEVQEDAEARVAEEAEDGGEIATDQDRIDEHGVARSIIRRSMGVLKTSPLSNVADLWSDQGEKMGLAWKRYDRLEWVHGCNEQKMHGTMGMQASHELELRPKKHYPTHTLATDEDKHTLEEPPPVEGFLVRLTSQKGRHNRMGRNFFKKLYFSTHDQFLCFCEPSKAIPPKPPRLLEADDGNRLEASEIAGKIPLVFAVNPYPLDGQRITWLSSKNVAEKEECDRRAYEEAERRTNSLLETQGYINLCHVTRVRKVNTDMALPPEEDQGGVSTDEDNPNRARDLGTTTTANNDYCFELLMKNGLIVRLQAYDKTARKEWIKRLRQLVKYWKLKIVEDVGLLKRVRQLNVEKLQIDEEMEAMLGQSARKWEVSRSVASAELYNMCGISCCRAVIMSGVLYRKPRLHSTFKRCSVILCHGKLLVFQSTLRKQTGREIPHIHHERQEVIDLSDTYVYSGLITDADLLYQNRTFDSSHPGHSALARVYREDGWTSRDEDTMTCFVLWHGKRRSLFRANARGEDGRLRSKLRYVSSLGVTGRAMVFKCRSRTERDRWVLSLGIELERLAGGGEDIRVVPKK